MAFSNRFLSKSFDENNIGKENQSKTKEKERIDYNNIGKENQSKTKEKERIDYSNIERENQTLWQNKNTDMVSIKGENSSDTINIIYPKVELEDLNKQCYNIQSILLDASNSKDIDLHEINIERITLDAKLSVFLSACEKIKQKGRLFDKVTKQTHRFFNNVKDDNTCVSSKNVEEQARLKKRELMISQLQVGRQNLDEEGKEIEFQIKKFQDKQRSLEELENTIDNMDRISFKEKSNKEIWAPQRMPIFKTENFKEHRNDNEIWAPQRMPTFKTENFKEHRNDNEIWAPQRVPIFKTENFKEHRKDNEIWAPQRVPIFKNIENFKNEDRTFKEEFEEGLYRKEYKTSSHKEYKDDTASQYSIKSNSIKSKPMQKMDENVYQLFCNQQELNKKLSNKTNTNRILPSIEPIVFDGDFTKYKDFLISFQTNIESNCDSEIHKLNYLMKYTKGEPNTIVSSCIHLDEDQCFIKAKQMLEKQYGNPNRIAQSFLDKLMNWKEITREDRVKINELYFYLNQIKNNMKNMTLLNQLNNPVEIRNIVRKLPMSLQHRFKQKAFEIHKKNEQVTFNHFVEFMEDQSEYVSFPVFDEIGYKYQDAKKEINKEKTNKGKTFFTQKKDEPSKEVKGNSYKGYKGYNKYCLYCEWNNHFLNTCNQFNKIKHEDKIEFIKQNKLCFRCLKNNHFSGQCQNPEVCSVCEKNHLTILHREYDNDNIENKNKREVNTKENMKEKEAKVLTVNLDNKNGKQNEKNFHSKMSEHKVFFPTVPVQLKYKYGNKTILTNLALDTFSSGCFIDESLVTELGIKINNNQKG